MPVNVSTDLQCWSIRSHGTSDTSVYELPNLVDFN